MLDHSARLKLLDEIKKRPFLYDRDDPHYQDKEMRQNAWKEIASKFKKYNDNALQDAWFSLRKCYRRCVYGYMKRGTKPVWPLYGPMSFLEQHIISTSKELKKIKGVNDPNAVPSQISTPKSSSEFPVASNGELKHPDASTEEHAPMEVEDNNMELNAGGNALLEALLELKQRATDDAEDSDISVSHTPPADTVEEHPLEQNEASETSQEIAPSPCQAPSTSAAATSTQRHKPATHTCAPVCPGALAAAAAAEDDAEMAFGRHVAICLRKMASERKCRAMTAIIEALHRDEPVPNTPDTRVVSSEY